MSGQQRGRVALVSARMARDTDYDLPPLIDAFRAAGTDVHVEDWDDESAPWHTYELALVRSTWDYTLRYEEFFAWAERAASLTTLLNPLQVIRWNTDKRYLLDLERAHVPVIPSLIIEPGESVEAAVTRFLSTHDEPELVVKPTIGAGARGARRHERSDRASIAAHAQWLLGEGRSVLMQPYLTGVEQHGETALSFFDGRFSHAIRKGPLLQRGAAASQALYAEEQISPRTPAADELQVAGRALAAIPFGVPVYARVDLIRGSSDAPLVLEIELTEPSLFFAQAPGSAARLVEAVLSTRSRLC